MIVVLKVLLALTGAGVLFFGGWVCGAYASSMKGK